MRHRGDSAKPSPRVEKKPDIFVDASIRRRYNGTSLGKEYDNSLTV